MRWSGAALAICLLSGVSLASELTPGEITDRFLEAETRLYEEFQHYTYTQTILFEELADSGVSKGRRLVEYDIYFDSNGQRQVRKTYDQGRLETIFVTQEDLDDAVSRQPFVLTKDVATDYHIDYVGKESVDELNTYVFEVEPRQQEPGKRYFKGKIFVDDVDFLIVMTSGKIIPDFGNNRYPAFETIREEIEPGLWFPTWSGADDYLEFGRWPNKRKVRVKEVITYKDFKRFEVGTSIQYDSEEPVPPASPSESPSSPPSPE